MREIYLDNNATTRTAPEVIDAMAPYFDAQYGNPSSLHKKGIEAERALKDARQVLADLLHVKTSEIYFTSGATESDNWALRGTAEALKSKGDHIITTKTEHDAVLETCKYLEKKGFKVSYLDVNEFGEIDESNLVDAVEDSTILVSIMHVNNEIGTIYPMNDLAKAVKNKNPDTIFFSDGAQAFGKIGIDLEDIDLYAISGHKMHGPKGVGALVVKEGTKIKPLLYGGQQEIGQRSGTENIPGIAGFAKASQLAYEGFKEKQEHFQALRKSLIAGIKEIEGTRVHSPQRGVLTTVSAGFKDVPAEVLLHALEEDGIYASSGSACSSGKQQFSHVLEAISVPYEYLNSTLRFGFSRYTTVEDIVFTCKVLKEKVEELRNITTKK